MSFNTLDKKIAIGRIPQSNYATPTAAGSDAFVEQIAIDPDSAFWSIEPRKMNNKGQGTGNRWATEAWVDAWDSALGFAFEASAQNLGRHLLAALGSVTSATSGDGFLHTFVPLDTKESMQLPTFSFLEKLAEDNDGINSIFPSGVCESIELAGDGLGRIKTSVQYRGSGKEASASGYDWADDVQSVQGTQNYFFATQANIEIGGYPGNSGAASLSCDLESWRFAYKNTLAADAGYRPGCPTYVETGNPESGVIRTECLLQDSAVEFEFTTRLKASDPNLARLKAQTPLEGKITVTGALIGGTTYHKLEIKFHLMKYTSHVRGVKDNIATVTIVPEILYSSSDEKILEIFLTNDVESYTT